MISFQNESPHVGVELFTAIIGLLIVLIPTWKWGIAYIEKRRLEKEKVKHENQNLSQKIISISDLVLKMDGNLKKHIAQFSANLKLNEKPIFICNHEGMWTDFNTSLLHFFNATSEQLHGSGWLNFITEEFRDHARGHWEYIIRHDIDSTFVYPVLSKVSDEVNFVEFRVVVIKDDGEILNVMGTVRRLKDRKDENKSKLQSP